MRFKAEYDTVENDFNINNQNNKKLCAAGILHDYIKEEHLEENTHELYKESLLSKHNNFFLR